MSARPVWPWALALLLATAPCGAHPLAFGTLDLRARGDGVYDVRWRFSGTERRSRGVEPRFPARCETVTGPWTTALDDGGEARQWRVRCPRGLSGETLTLRGMEGSGVQVLARHTDVDGAVDRAWLDDDHRQWTLRAQPAPWRAFASHVALGVAHIAAGYDHLLFVLGLLLLAGTRRRVVGAVTSFTAGHSVTLALAALGVVRLPVMAVEAAIAWSLVVVARELARATPTPTVTRRHPGVVAALFGLLHGFGFASALSTAGLPRHDVARALAGFNLGVELGQLAFVALCALLARVVPDAWTRRAPYLIGMVGMWACLDRVASMLR